METSRFSRNRHYDREPTTTTLEGIDDFTEEEEEEETKETTVTDGGEEGVIDMRDVFPIDENDAFSAHVLATLSLYMQKLSRPMTEVEQMGYVYTWMTVAASLLRVNAAEYATQNMVYTAPDQTFECCCYRAEIVTWLHEVCYQTMRQAADHIHGILKGTSMAPITLLPPEVRNMPLSFDNLCAALQTQVEMCQFALQHIHRTWDDFAAAFAKVEPPEDGALYMARTAAAHTATLGVVASHLYQVLRTLNKFPDLLAASTEPSLDKDEDAALKFPLRFVWQSTVTLFAAQNLLPYPDNHPYRDALHRLVSQLRLIVYRRKVNVAAVNYRWNLAEFFTARILKIVAPYGDELAANDRLALSVYHNKVVTQQLHTIPQDEKGPMKEFHQHATDLKLSDAAIQTMAPNAIATVCMQRLLKHRMIRSFPSLRLRMRGGQIVQPQPMNLM